MRQLNAIERGLTLYDKFYIFSTNLDAVVEKTMENHNFKTVHQL